MVSYSDIEANERLKEKLDLLGITCIRKQTLETLKEIYLENEEHIIGSFYKRLHSLPYLDEIIRTHTTDVRLKKTFHLYMVSLLDDELDLKYVFTRRSIAETHARIGLTPDWILSAFSLLKQLFIPLIVNSLKKKPTEIMDVILAYDSLTTLDMQIITETYMELQAKNFIDGLSEIISFNAEIDEIYNLLEYQEKQTEDSLSVSVAMEQLSVSVNEVASSVMDVSENTSDNLEQLNAGIQKIQEVTLSMNKIDQEQTTVSNFMKQLTDKVTNIEKIITFIKDISEQTNMLALNASIEAARAGSSGKGFAIVAEEVRKLADNTQSSIATIANDTVQLVAITEKVNKLIDESSAKLHDGVKNANEVSDNLLKINESSQSIGRHFEEIASISQQQAATTEDITYKNNRIHESLEKGVEIGIRTGRAVYQLSQMIDNYRLMAISKNMKISQEDILQLAITDHLLWRWKIYNMILGYEKLSPADVVTHNECRLGQWYQGPGKKLFASNADYIKLEKPHEQVHMMAKEATIAVNQGDKKRATEILEDITIVSNEVIDLLMKVKQSIVEQKAGYKASIVR